MRDGVLLAAQPGVVPAAQLDEIIKQVEALDMAEVKKLAKPASAGGPQSAREG
jgi:hypothetical protein